MIQKAIRKLSLPLFASAGITAAGLILYQRISLHRASRKGDKTPFESYTTPDGVSMAYERFGYGRPVVLLHSLHPGASRREWRPQIEKLAKDFRVYTVDLPGFGQSDQAYQTLDSLSVRQSPPQLPFGCHWKACCTGSRQRRRGHCSGAVHALPGRSGKTGAHLSRRHRQRICHPQ